MGRKPIGFRLRACATWGEMQVLEAPVSIRAGKMLVGAGAFGVAEPTGARPIFVMRPS